MTRQWWKEAVVYQIYPRSFCDSNGDGIGDLQGIISKLDYLRDLGVDVIWLSPIYRSPNDDNGYDVSDYRDIMQEFGTLADFDSLLQGVHERGMKLIMDLVVNHSSDEHAWFQASRVSKDNPFRDWYVWRPPREGREPNNWASFFQGSAWELDERTGEYYLHLFSKKQPDLNWENPELRAAVFDMMRWWLDKGVDGFRMDVINCLSKAEGLPDAGNTGDSPYVFAPDKYHYGPRLNDYLGEMRDKVLRDYDIMTVGETCATTTEQAVEMANPDTGFVDMVFQFEHMSLDLEPGAGTSWKPRPIDFNEFKAVISRWQTELEGRAWNSQYLNNHDQPRAVSRFTDDGRYRKESAKLLATVLHSLCGTPYIYQGEEIGMTNVAFPEIGDYRDIATLNTYAECVHRQGMSPAEVMPLVHRYSRDNARTPMQWNDNAHAGFSSGEPWIGVNPNYTRINVEEALADPESVLHYYRRLIRLRRELPVMVYGDYRYFEGTPAEVFVFRRSLDDATLMVVANFSGLEQHTAVPAPGGGRDYHRLIGNYPDTARAPSDHAVLRPYEAAIYIEQC